MQLNWLIYVSIQSRAVLPNLGLKQQQVYRGSFGRLHIAKLQALLEIKTRQTEALFARHILFRIMMYLTENNKVNSLLCHSIIMRWAISQLAIIMRTISEKQSKKVEIYLILASIICVVLVLVRECFSQLHIGVGLYIGIMVTFLFEGVCIRLIRHHHNHDMSWTWRNLYLHPVN